MVYRTSHNIVPSGNKYHTHEKHNKKKGGISRYLFPWYLMDMGRRTTQTLFVSSDTLILGDPTLLQTKTRKRWSGKLRPRVSLRSKWQSERISLRGEGSVNQVSNINTSLHIFSRGRPSFRQGSRFRSISDEVPKSSVITKVDKDVTSRFLRHN